jgi:hypothetical protein
MGTSHPGEEFQMVVTAKGLNLYSQVSHCSRKAGWENQRDTILALMRTYSAGAGDKRE